jgi:high-affinity Fe2+/Pb2+ permease
LTKSKANFTIIQVKQTLHLKEKIMNKNTAIPLGVAIGAAIGAATGAMAVWVGIGAAFGLAMSKINCTLKKESGE